MRDDRQDRERFITRLGTMSSETKTSIYAWSLMGNHAHILVKSGPKGIAQLARNVGVSTTAISKIMSRGRGRKLN